MPIGSKHIFTGIFLTLLGGAAMFWKFNSTSIDRQETIFDDLRLKKNISGFPLQLDKIKSEYYVINFWASWCPPCVEETPSLVRFVAKNPGKYHLIAISQDSSMKDIEDFLKVFPLLRNPNTEVLWDDNRNLARRMNVSKLPETFIYSLQNHRVLNVSGSTNWDDPETERYINNYFQKK